MPHIDLSPLINAAIIALAGVLASLGMLARKWIASKIKNDGDRVIFEKAADFIGTEVQAIEQAVVPEIKAAMSDGKVTPEEATRIRNMAIDRVKQNLGADGVQRLTDALGERPVGDYLVSLLESKVLKNK